MVAHAAGTARREGGRGKMIYLYIFVGETVRVGIITEEQMRMNGKGGVES